MTTVSPAFEVHTLPSGDTLVYRDRDHSYWREANGEKGSGRLAGVTTVIAPMDWRPDGLMSWAARMTCKGVAALAAEGLGCEDAAEMLASLTWLREGETIDRALADARLTHRDARDDAATRGTNVHLHALHALADGKPVPEYDEMTAEERGYSRGVGAWWLGAQPEVIASEFVVADLELGVAGRPDLLCRLRDGRVAVVDAKTSGYLSAKFSVQLSGYSRLAVASGYEAPEVGVILQVAEDGSFNAVEVTLDDADFLAALDVYRRAGRITGELRKAAKA